MADQLKIEIDEAENYRKVTIIFTPTSEDSPEVNVDTVNVYTKQDSGSY